jgi:hypothetical protein
VGVILSESLDKGVARWTSSGHSAVYVSRICPATPVTLRLCEPGEQGSVINNYKHFGEEKDYQWNIVPLSVFLYGVEDTNDRPLFASEKLKQALAEGYREKALSLQCPGPPCTESKKAEWRAMIGQTQVRSLYIFVAPTTLEQDLELIAKYNSLPNKNHYDGAWRNCATFAQHLVNSYFPGASHPDFINDFGMVSPKAITRSFAKYAERHLGAEYHALHFAQIPGTIKRSRTPRNGTEQLVHSPPWLVPIAYLSYHSSLALLGVYELTGRFNLQRELEARPTVRAGELQLELEDARGEKDAAEIERLEAMISRERAEVVGEREDWAKYRAEFDAIVGEAIRDAMIPGREAIDRIFKSLENAGTPVLDENGKAWMEIREPGQVRRVGLNTGNIFTPGSDFTLSYQLMLGHIDRVLKSPNRSREGMAEFKQDWALLLQARSRSLASAAYSPARPAH